MNIHRRHSVDMLKGYIQIVLSATVSCQDLKRHQIKYCPFSLIPHSYLTWGGRDYIPIH